ncbi:dTMP kinase [Paraliomyxa miuraensis]|uniref:dTMP kinase n=1 Tax=Paraliomyxa miuraensis TaxID=376150 RepID=UPI002254AADC|nr:dTMP kinase [Paraliomyxa miuraensis]MCX4244582.1 dTMP kinase [Paraliomyxa miuraensis]
MSRGRFIALEGIDGSGTTSQRGALAEALRGRGHVVLETNEPSSGSIGRLARERLAHSAKPLDRGALALLFAADRLDHVATEIEPALAAGRIVLTDRYLMSSWAYQSMDCEPQWVRTINARAPWPDLTLVLEVPATEAMRRVSARRQRQGPQLEIYETLALQERLARAYAELARDRSLANVTVIDGTGSMERVTEALLEACEAIGL